tara:strand:+ start:46 stop:723 length:678 start_codon:yes stop_codon:yes gene_type:complete
MNKQHATILLYTAGGILGVVGLIFYVKTFSVKAKAVRKAKQEWKDWGEQTVNVHNQTIKSGGQENEAGYSDRVKTYWKEGTGLNYDGTDRDVAWSATWISFIWKKAGAGTKFKYSPSHSEYIRDSISNRKANNFSKPFIGLRVSEYAPEVGDMVCYSREGRSDLYNETGAYKSHCDIVVKKGRNFIEVIGGNVGQSVTKKILVTDDNGYLIDNNSDWFTIIKSNL